MRVEHRFLSVDGLRLHALDFGGDGHPILLLHGITGHGWLWHDVAGQLTLWGHVLALDLRGHGDSQWPADGVYDSTTVADDVAAIIEWLGQRADVIGLSWGGLVAMRLAARHPGVIRRLAVLDAPVRALASEHDVPQRPYEFANHADLLQWERQDNPRSSDRLVSLVANHGVRPAADGRFVRKHDARFTERWPFRAEDFDADWSQLSVPTLLVRAGDSAVFNPDQYAAMLASQPRATGLVVAGSGHLLPLERPIEVADALEGFLREEALDADVIGEAREMLEIP